MPSRIAGRYERTLLAGAAVSAFVPAPLPPSPPLDLGGLGSRLEAADAGIARLALVSEMAPALDWLGHAFVRKEAVLASRAAGARATLVDLLAFEAGPGEVVPAELQPVRDYLDALAFARDELRDEGGLRLSTALLNETHQWLMGGARGADEQAGEVRRTQNWIGGTRPGNAAYVPPPPHHLGELLGAFDRYLEDDHTLPPLVRAGLLHAQLHTIHPYVDGNGRIGRIFLTLLLEQGRPASQALLYVGPFLERQRDEYHRRLNAVRTDGAWEAWLDFFLASVAAAADDAVATARELAAIVAAGRARVLAGGTTSVAAMRLFEILPEHPIVTMNAVAAWLATSKPTATRAIDALLDAGVLRETTGRKRDRMFAYDRYVERLSAGTEPDVHRQAAG